MAALDVMEKAANVEVYQAELNDFLGVILKLRGSVDDVATALQRGADVAARLRGRPVTQIIPQVDAGSWQAIQSPAEFNVLIQQDVVTFPLFEPAEPTTQTKELTMTSHPPALGFIETQGFTAVFAAIDAACKTANVEVLGKEKLGGGYVTVIVQGDVAAVKAAIEAAQAPVAGLGTLIAAHVITGPAAGVLSLLPRA